MPADDLRNMTLAERAALDARLGYPSRNANAQQTAPREDSINARLLRGEFVDVGGKLLGLCSACRKVIRVDKPIVGSMHICAPPG